MQGIVVFIPWKYKHWYIQMNFFPLGLYCWQVLYAENYDFYSLEV